MVARTCKLCSLEKEAVQGVWVMKHGKPEGKVCLACTRRRTHERHQQLIILDTGEVITYRAAALRKHYAIPENRARRGAEHVAYAHKRRQTDNWFRLRVTLAGKTNKLLTRISNGGTPKDETCFKLFGASLTEVLVYFNRQLDATGLDWTDYKIKWTCDHKEPVALAQSDVELRQMFKLANCQVLTMEEHAIKTVVDNARVRALGV